MLKITTSSICAIALATAVGAAGCAVDNGPTSGSKSSSTEPATLADAPGAIQIDGRTYLPAGSDYSPPPHNKPIGELTRTELAENFSPMLGTSDGHLYHAAELNLDFADAFLAGRLLGDVVDGHAPGAPGAASGPSLTPDAWNFTGSNAGHPQTSDSRYYSGNMGWPYTAIVFLNLSNGSTCTGTYIGTSYDTLITAAHCLRNNGSSRGVTKFTPVALGFNGNVSYAPYGSFSGCYNWWYPTAWDNQTSGGCPGNGDEHGNGCYVYDYAVVDFRPCGNPTIYNTGTMGVDINNTNITYEYVDGFPSQYSFFTDNGQPDNNGGGTTYNACGNTTNPGNYYPFMCGQDGHADFNNDGYTVESDSITVSPGDSGGPIWEYHSGDPAGYVDGIVTGGRWYTDFFRCGFDACYRNYGRGIDTTVWNFITTYAKY